MAEKRNEFKRKEQDQGSVINIGDISKVSGGNVNITGREITRAHGDRTTNTEGGAYIEGNINTGGGDFVGRDRIDIVERMEDAKSLFAEIYQRIDQTPAANLNEREDLRQIVKDIEQQATKLEDIDVRFLSYSLRILGRLSPIILEAVQTMLMRPTATFNATARQVAEKMRETSSSAGA